jgi:hypothetical protein
LTDLKALFHNEFDKQHVTIASSHKPRANSRL